jgi:hypothetical protein
MDHNTKTGHDTQNTPDPINNNLKLYDKIQKIYQPRAFKIKHQDFLRVD